MKFKKVISALLVLFFLLLGSVTNRLFAYEPSLINLTTPSGLSPWEGEISIFHRFYGSVLNSPLETVFGMEAGANVGLGMRLQTFDGLELKASYISGQKTFTAGSSFSWYLPYFFLHTQLDLQFFTFRSTSTERIGHFYTSLAWRTDPIFDLLVPTLAVAYDGYFQRLELGAGLHLKIVQFLSLVIEFYPFWPGGRNPGEQGDTSTYAFGIMLNTWGHHFVLLLSNSFAIGQRGLMAGTADTGLYLGFNIQRHFIF